MILSELSVELGDRGSRSFQACVEGAASEQWRATLCSFVGLGERASLRLSLTMSSSLGGVSCVLFREGREQQDYEKNEYD